MNQPLFSFSALRGSVNWFMAALLLDAVSVILFLLTGILQLRLLATVATAYCIYLTAFAAKMNSFEDHVKVKKGSEVMDWPYSRITKVDIFRKRRILWT